MPNGLEEILKDQPDLSPIGKVNLILKKIKEEIHGPDIRDPEVWSLAMDEMLPFLNESSQKIELTSEQAKNEMFDLITASVFVNRLFQEEYDPGLSRDVEYEKFRNQDKIKVEGIKVKKRLSILAQIRENLLHNKNFDENNEDVKSKKYSVRAAIIDLRRLREVDNFNPAEADALLIHVAEELQKIMEEYQRKYSVQNQQIDIQRHDEFVSKTKSDFFNNSGIRCTVGRYGGDEFILLIESFMDFEDFLKEINRIMPMDSKDNFIVRRRKEKTAGSAGSILVMVSNKLKEIKSRYKKSGREKIIKRGAAINDEVKFIEIPDNLEDYGIWEGFLNRGILLDQNEIQKAKNWLMSNPIDLFDVEVMKIPELAEDIASLVTKTTNKYPRLKEFFDAAADFDEIWQRALGQGHPHHVTKQLLETFYHKIVNPLLGEYFYTKDKINYFFQRNEYNDIIFVDFPLKEINDYLGYYEGDWLMKDLGDHILAILMKRVTIKNSLAGIDEMVDARPHIDVAGGEGSSYCVAIKKGVKGLEKIDHDLKAIHPDIKSNPNLVLPFGVASLAEYRKTHGNQNPESIYDIKKMAEDNTFQNMYNQMQVLHKKFEANIGRENLIFNFGEYLTQLNHKMDEQYLKYRLPIDLVKATSMDEFYYLYFIKSARADDRKAKFLEVMRKDIEKNIAA